MDTVRQAGFPLGQRNRTYVRPGVEFWTYKISKNDKTGVLLYWLLQYRPYASLHLFLDTQCEVLTNLLR